MANNGNLFFRFSRYIKNAVSELIDGNEHIGLLDITDIPTHRNDLFLTVTGAYEYRPDLISKEFYGTTKLWWIIPLANNVEDVLNYPKSGDSIRIPTMETVQRYM
jgi:hypothetical protein